MEPNTMSGPMTAFIEDAYQDTLSLMTELRDFLAEVQAAPEDPNADRPPDVRARIVKEISSITRNLTEAMAWLLLQKAAGAGEITPEEAETRADGLLAQVDADRIAAADGAELPLEIRGYMDRSRRLYDQVLSLREMVSKQTG
ncbi:MAG: DUF1465 family protein [Rhodospirillaceae bacterium]|nr:DUF1465 family protein [Rhodospirillaceae bacterium]